jgi:hypothetical protein
VQDIASRRERERGILLCHLQCSGPLSLLLYTHQTASRAALGGWPYVLAMLISALAISPATLIVLSPFLCCCACTGCLDVEDVMDDSKLLIFMTSGLWPYALAIVVLALAAAVASVPLVLPFVLYNGCKTRSALDQDDGHMRASV